MTEPNTKTLKIKMRGQHGSAKTEFLRALARLARGLGMSAELETDGHNMAITSTAAQRCALFDFNRGGGGRRSGLACRLAWGSGG